MHAPLHYFKGEACGHTFIFRFSKVASHWWAVGPRMPKFHLAVIRLCTVEGYIFRVEVWKLWLGGWEGELGWGEVVWGGEKWGWGIPMCLHLLPISSPDIYHFCSCILPSSIVYNVHPFHSLSIDSSPFVVMYSCCVWCLKYCFYSRMVSANSHSVPIVWVEVGDSPHND